MPYLNWKEFTQVQQAVASLGPSHHGRDEKQRVTLGIDRERLGELVAILQETFQAPLGSELRLDLPRNWIVFWKRREGESRLLLAHPQAEEWVATVAVETGHGEMLVNRLSQLVVGQSVNVGELAPTGNVSNVELTLTLIE